MSLESERPIENLLRACARKGREQADRAGLSLHPATRRLLQGEVARRYATPQKPPGWFAGWLPFPLRSAWALTAAVVITIGLTAAIWLSHSPRSQKPMLLAEHRAPAKPSPVKPAAADKTAVSPAKDIPTESEPSPAPSSPIPRSPATPPPSAASELRSGAADRLSQSEPRPDASSIRTESKPEIRSARGVAAQPQLVKEEVAPAAAPAPVVLAPSRPSERPKTKATLVSDALPSNQPASAVAGRMDADRTPARQTDEKQQPSSGTNALYRMVAVSTPAASPPVAAPLASPAKASSTPAAPALAQRFIRAGSTLKPSRETRTSSAALLASFRVEQADGQLRVIDTDGSVYTGSWEAVDLKPSGLDGAAVESSRSYGGKLSRASPRFGGGATGGGTKNLERTDTSSALSYVFRVTGTNRSLKQPVVFTANLVPTNSLAGQVPASAPAGRTGSPAPSYKPGASWLLHSRLSGQAWIGNKPPVAIEAVPAP